MSDEQPTMQEVEERIFVSNEEVFAEIARTDPTLVKYTAARLQNKKMKAILNEHLGVGQPEGA